MSALWERVRFSSTPQTRGLPKKKQHNYIAAFDQASYAAITGARLEHLKGLSLPVSGKTVVDIGSGIGRLADFFVDQGCDVLCVDGREENIRHLRQLYPDRACTLLDVEKEELTQLGRFDIVFCYGVLYHLADPFGFLQKAYNICNEFMIVETCIMDSDCPAVRLVKEDCGDVTQALREFGARPSPAYVVACLHLSGFRYIYTPRKKPSHPEFRYQRHNDYSVTQEGRLLREIFVASHRPINSRKLRRCNQVE